MQNYIFPFLWMRGEPEEVIREEMSKIRECGIGAVCVEARPHDDFCGPLWWRDMDIVLDEAKKHDMKVWILDDKHFPTGYAAGLIAEKYPERKKWYIADTVVDVFGSSHPRTINVDRMLKPVIGFWQIGAPVNYEERANNRLVALTATRFAGQDTFEEETIDLTDAYKDGKAEICLPEGQWRVHALYKTRTDGGSEEYINMIDRVSAGTQIEGVYEAHYQHYKDEFGKTIAGFFSDEPALGNTNLIAFDTSIGRPDLAYPWSQELEDMLASRYGKAYKKLLPFLFVGAEREKNPDGREQKNGRGTICAQFRYDYMDCVSRLYEADFSRQIGDWCREHGVEYIGHVVEDNSVHSRTGYGTGHWFRAMAGQDMAGIDVIGSQVIFGAPVEERSGMGGNRIDGEFFHEILGKMGASSGHLDPKKKGRTMCELFGAYGWNFGVRDMKYLLDHLLCRGVNHLVPHAFSMAEYPDVDCPPHFYARGNNPQFPWFAHLMKYANRMCAHLNGGQHAPSVAVLYDGEADWTGKHMPMQKVGRVLLENQIEFDVISLDMLRKPEEWHTVCDKDTLTINGVAFQALIVPYTEYIPCTLAKFALQSGKFPVIFVDDLPRTVLSDEWGEGKEWSEGEREKEWKEASEIVKLSGLAQYLEKRGMKPIHLDPPDNAVTVYHYRRERACGQDRKTGNLYMVMNEDPDRTYRGTITLPGNGEFFWYDGMKDAYLEIADQEHGERSTVLPLELAPGESGLFLEGNPADLCAAGGNTPFYAEDASAVDASAADTAAEKKGGSGKMPLRMGFESQRKECPCLLELSGGWKLELCRAKEYPEAFSCTTEEELAPVSDRYPAFSGVMRYTKEFELTSLPEKAFFFAENVYEVMKITVNGKETGVCLTPPYQMEITPALAAGRNEIVVEIANTPGRDQSNYPAPPFDFQHECTEKSGMFGKVGIYFR